LHKKQASIEIGADFAGVGWFDLVIKAFDTSFQSAVSNSKEEPKPPDRYK